MNEQPILGDGLYTPEMIVIRKDGAYAALRSLQTAIEHIKESYQTHINTYGTSTIKNRSWATQLQADIAEAEQAWKLLHDDVTKNFKRIEDAKLLLNETK